LRILLISPKFYGIEIEIQLLLKHLNYDVEWIENRGLFLDYHSTSSKFKNIRKIYFYLFAPRERYLKKVLNNLNDKRFDILFSINGHVICSYLFKNLKHYNPSLKSVLYLWDASSMYCWAKELKLFDKVFTFDPGDSEKYSIEYKPNFYIKPSEEFAIDQRYDLFFAGKFSSLRLSVLDRIAEISRKFSLDIYFKLWPGYKILFHNKIVYYLLVKINLSGTWIKNYILNFEAIEGILKKSYITNKSLDYSEMQKYLLCSNVILDIPFHGQKGHSHRIIEALANGKKVITTNLYIKTEAFFNSEQIYLMDPENPILDVKWIRNTSTFPVAKDFENLELSLWLKSILNV
jgi:hypothetical protein